MSLFGIINEAASSWYDTTGNRAVRIILHPKNYADLLYELNTNRFVVGESALGGTSLVPEKMTLCTVVAPLEVMVAAQESQDEFVLADDHHNMMRFTILEGGNVRTLLDAPAVLVVKRSKMFLKRDAKSRYYQDLNCGWSDRLLQEVSERFDLIIVFHDVFSYRQGEGIWPIQTLQDKVKSLGLKNIGVVNYNSHQRMEAIQIWKERILEVGGRIKRVANVRDINCFSIPGLTVGDHITWVDENGDHGSNIIVEKARSFMDLAKDRESRSKW